MKNNDSHFLPFTSNLTPMGNFLPYYDKRDDYSFDILNFPHLDSNIPTVPVYEVYISQLVRSAQASSLYLDFLQCHSFLSTKVSSQGFLKNCIILTVFSNIFWKISSPCWKVFFHMLTDDKRWCWQLWLSTL